MPLKEQPPVQSSVSRVATRASNANKHPGTEAHNVLRVQRRRDPEVIIAEKEMKLMAKEAKERAKLAQAERKDNVQRRAQEYRGRQEAAFEAGEVTARRQQVQGTFATVCYSYSQLTIAY